MGMRFTFDPDLDNPELYVIYGCAWDEIFFKIMLTSILLDELEKISDYLDFNNTRHLQKINKRKQRPIIKKLKKNSHHDMLEQVEKLLDKRKKKSSIVDDIMSEDPDVKDEDEGYCSEQTADLTSDDSDLEERT